MLYLNIVLSWPEDGRLWPKHVANYNLTVIIASCLDVCCVLTVHNMLYKMEIALMMWEKKILRKIYGPTYGNGSRGIKMNREMYNKFKSPDTGRVSR